MEKYDQKKSKTLFQLSTDTNTMTTKKYSMATGQPFGHTLQDKNHRIAYHRTEASKNPAVYRGGTLLPLHHPAMTPCLSQRDHSYKRQKKNNISNTFSMLFFLQE